MTLYTAHKVVIAMAIAFSALFAVRAAVLWFRDGGSLPIVLLLASAAGAFALSVYLRWLVRAKRRQIEVAAKRRSSVRDN